MPVTPSEAQSLTMANLKDLLSRTALARRSSPTIIINFNSYSILDMIAQVEMNTAIGQRYISYFIKSIGETISG